MAWPFQLRIYAALGGYEFTKKKKKALTRGGNEFIQCISETSMYSTQLNDPLIYIVASINTC